MIRPLENPGSTIQLVQAGDHRLREQLIADHVPFIKRTVRRITHTYFVDQNDEYSIALEAFNTAIDHYHAESDVPFEAYAGLLIKNRLLNWFRQQKHALPTVSLSESDTDDGIPLSERLADPKGSQIQENLEFEEAMIHLELALKQFRLTMAVVTARFPSHQDSCRLCIRVARQLTSDDALYGHMMQCQQLPGQELARRCQVSVKTIEKNRSSIIFLSLLMQSELQGIQAYITYFEKGASK